MKLSIISTLYRSSKHIDEFYKRVSESAKAFTGDDYEIIFVNDGSPDDSLEKAIACHVSDTHVIVVDLSRNFGHHQAMVTGLQYSKGDLIFLIDSDLEEEPEWLVDFAEKMEKEDCDVVYGIQKKRKGDWFERWTGNLFYRIFNMLSRIKMPENWVTARLMTRRYVDALLLHRERELSIGGLYLLAGFEQRSCVITKHSTSGTTYTLARKIAVLVNTISSLSDKPLVGIFYIGVMIFLIAALYVFYLILKWFFLSTPISGWTSVIASIWLLGGLTISFLGVIGIYLSKVFLESKQRPLTIVREVYCREVEQ